MVVCQGRVKLVRSMDPAAIDDHHDLFVGFAEDRHHLMQILPQLLGIKVRPDLIEDFGGAILDRLAFAGLLAFDVALAHWACREAHARRFAPPAHPGQGKTPENRFICIEQNDLAPTCLILEGSKCERARGEVCGVGIKAPGGPIVAYLLFFNTPRTLSRPSWTPVARAKTVASSRQLQWEWRAPCSRGS